MKLTLDRLFGNAALTVSVALSIALVVTVGALAWPRLAAGIGTKAKAPEPAYRPGLTIDTPADWYGRSARTLVIIARSECGACQQARPFLKQLVDDVAERATVVLASPGADPKMEVQFGSEIGLDEASVKRVPPGGLRATRVPTLVLVDRTGRILAAWEGAPPAKQTEIRQSIKALTPGAQGNAAGRTDIARLVRGILSTSLTFVSKS
jgi:hypothetical protein